MSNPAPTSLAELLAWQSEGCSRSGSALYGRLFDIARADYERGGPVASVLADPGPDPAGSAYVLRFMGGVHRLVLEGAAPELAAFFPTAGGTYDQAGGEDPAAAFLAVVEDHHDALVDALDRAVQTNEVGRCAALVVGFLAVSAAWGRPLQVLEIGASAGLNLRWDQFRYEGGAAGSAWGPVDARLRFDDIYRDPRPSLAGDAAVVARRGCDRAPIDATTSDGRLTLLSFVWPDQLDRLARLDAAIEVAREVPLTVDRADAGEWIERRLADRGAARGAATVVYHSVVWQYLPGETQERVRAAITGAGQSATSDEPVAWLRFEPADDPARGAEVRLRMWPGGEDRLLTRGGYHGRPVRVPRDA